MRAGRARSPTLEPPLPRRTAQLRTLGLAEEKKRCDGNAQNGRSHHCDLPAAKIAQPRNGLVCLDAHDLLPVVLYVERRPFTAGLFELGHT